MSLRAAHVFERPYSRTLYIDHDINLCHVANFPPTYQQPYQDITSCRRSLFIIKHTPVSLAYGHAEL